MEFYNPMARKTASPTATPIKYSSVPGGSENDASHSMSSGYGLNQQRLGNIDFQQAGTGQWGTGASFQGAGRQGILEEMTKGMSAANPEDYAGMDELRNYYRNQLSDLPGQTADKISSYDTQSQRGMKNLMSQYTNSQAGTGRIGSRQYAGAQGDILSKAMSDYNAGLLNARTNAIGQANQIQSGLSGVQNQNMNERQFQADSSQRMSDMIYKLMSLDKGTPDVGAQRAAEDKARTQQMITSGATLAGMAIAASDSRVKTGARPATRQEILKPFRKVIPHSYRYIDEKRHGKGDQISPMAQDLQKSEFADSVFEAENGVLMVDYGKLMPRMFSAISELTNQIDELKGELKAIKGGT